MNKKTVIAILICLVISTGCNNVGNTSDNVVTYAIEEKVVGPWQFTGGELWKNDGQEGFEFSEINYISEDATEFTELFLLFYIDHTDEEGHVEKETLFTYSEGQSEPYTINKGFTILGGGTEGPLLKTYGDYNFDCIYVNITMNNENVSKTNTYRLDMR